MLRTALLSALLALAGCTGSPPATPDGGTRTVRVVFRYVSATDELVIQSATRL